MKEDILISIKGLHSLAADDGEDEIEVIYPGKYRKLGETGCIRYTEVTEDGSSENLIKLKKGSIELVKNGTTTTHMVFECGKKTFTEYLTPFGMFDLGVNALEVEVKEEEHRIDAFARYTLDADGNFLSECQIRLVVQPCEEVTIQHGNE